jgi:hypothetical protein
MGELTNGPDAGCQQRLVRISSPAFSAGGDGRAVSSGSHGAAAAHELLEAARDGQAGGRAARTGGGGEDRVT